MLYSQLSFLYYAYIENVCSPRSNPSIRSNRRHEMLKFKRLTATTRKKDTMENHSSEFPNSVVPPLPQSNDQHAELSPSVIVTSMCHAPVASPLSQGGTRLESINAINLARYLRKRAIVKLNPSVRFPLEIYTRIQKKGRTVH